MTTHLRDEQIAVSILGTLAAWVGFTIWVVGCAGFCVLVALVEGVRAITARVRRA